MESRENHLPHEEEVPRWQKAFDDQFVLTSTVESPNQFSYRDLGQWIQCLQSVLIICDCHN